MKRTKEYNMIKNSVERTRKMNSSYLYKKDWLLNVVDEDVDIIAHLEKNHQITKEQVKELTDYCNETIKMIEKRFI